jgi:hypothetical protein
MSPAEIAAMIRVADMVLCVIENLGVSKARFDALRQTGGGHLNDEAVDELAELAHESVRKLG